MRTADFDYVIVGSGAGGGPLAAKLAQAGFTVMLLEAGGDSCAASEQGRFMYEVPIFHGLSTEYAECQWDYFVHHYADAEKERCDPKFVHTDRVSGADVDGIWYPRAGTLGGCTAHNAMITVTPQNCDWDYIAQLTGDRSWRAEDMNRYFTRLENCTYVPRPDSWKYRVKGVLWSLVALLGARQDWRDWAHGHGFGGWLTTSESDPRLVLKDDELVPLLVKAVLLAFKTGLGNPLVSLLTWLDPNDVRSNIAMREGLALTPLAVANGKRNGPRDLLLRTRAAKPGNLTVQLHALATRVLFEGQRAVGVEFYEGEHLYEADPAARAVGGQPSFRPRQVSAAREVIVAAGAFNSPQLLKLSGVGPRRELERLGIDVVVDAAGVGENLQDRYEVGIVSEFPKPFALLGDATFAPPQAGATDPYFVEWQSGKGLYTSNGALLGILKRSDRRKPEPDLYIFGLPGFFTGYQPGYSASFERYRNRFTWAVLKAYTETRAGRVTLRSKDPTKWPRIDFHYFSEGNDAGEDLDAVVDGVEFVRKLNDTLGSVTEVYPTREKYGTRDRLREFVQNEAWGHHASCTNRIGADGDPGAVLDSRFRVRSTEALRVVDASVFPKIPGYFIVSAVYMISEKASDVVIEDANRGPSAR